MDTNPDAPLLLAGFTLYCWPDEHAALRFPAAEAADIADRINAASEALGSTLDVGAWGFTTQGDAYTVDNGAWYVTAVPADYVATPKPGIRHVRAV